VSTVTVIVGIFVGGKARRMGGTAKGLLPVSGGTTVVQRTVDLARQLGARTVLVGRNEAYDLGLPSLPDPDGNLGPLGGLWSLLEHAGRGHAIALACDMPHITGELLGRLAGHASTARAVAPKRDGRWEPLFARYDAGRSLEIVRARLSRSELSLQGLLDELDADELPLLPGDDKLLGDWDRPEDIT
jgi:molybdopterin-guanine dinucleotide biosynthesis protein A